MLTYTSGTRLTPRLALDRKEHMKYSTLIVAALALLCGSAIADTLDPIKPAEPVRLMPPGMAIMTAVMTKMKTCRTGKCTAETCPVPEQK